MPFATLLAVLWVVWAAQAYLRAGPVPQRYARVETSVSRKSPQTLAKCRTLYEEVLYLETRRKQANSTVAKPPESAASAQEKQPWDEFEEFIQRKAASVIGGFHAKLTNGLEPADPSEALSRHTLAASVVSGIEKTWDDKLRKFVSQLDFTFSCILWNAQIPEEYEHFVVVGDSKNVRGKFIVRNGLAIFEGCHGGQKHHSPPGTFGFPCKAGAVVQLLANTGQNFPLHCIVQYRPVSYTAWRGVFGPNPDTYLEAFKASLKSVIMLDEHARLTRGSTLDLTEIAEGFIVGQPNWGKSSYRYIFRCLVLVPAFGTPEPLKRGLIRESMSSFVGLDAKSGHFIIDHVHVPIPEPRILDLNEPPPLPEPLTIYFIALLPIASSYDIPLPPCKSCK